MFGTTPSVPASRIEPSGTAAEGAWLATAAASRKAAAPRPSTTNRRRPPDARWRPRSAVTGSVISHPSHLGAAPHLLGRPSAGGRPSDWRRGYLLVFDLYRYRLLWIGVGQGSARGHRARLRAGAPRALRGASGRAHHAHHARSGGRRARGAPLSLPTREERRSPESKEDRRISGNGQSRSNSPSLAPATNASHSAGVKINAGPTGSLESRMAIAPSTKATSTQASEYGPLRLLLRQSALSRLTEKPLVSISTTAPLRAPRSLPPTPRGAARSLSDDRK